MRLVPAPRRCSGEEATAVVGSRAEPHDPHPDLCPPALLTDADTGEAVIAVDHLAPELSARLHELLPRLPLTTTLRASSGYRNMSRIFGWSPAKPVMEREGCRSTDVMAKEPATAEVLMDVADEAGRWLRRNLPRQARRDRDTLAAVDPEWRLTPGPGDLWTSGVINRNSPMPYHRDGSNFPSWSAMTVTRRGVIGGHLHLPEYDVTVPCADGTVLYWWGQRYVHGVTPMRLRPRAGGYRFTVVYYALRGMRDCAEFAYAAAESRAARTRRETEMAARGDWTGHLGVQPRSHVDGL